MIVHNHPAQSSVHIRAHPCTSVHIRAHPCTSVHIRAQSSVHNHPLHMCNSPQLGLLIIRHCASELPVWDNVVLHGSGRCPIKAVNGAARNSSNRVFQHYNAGANGPRRKFWASRSDHHGIDPVVESMR
jgi:hypothetical protein